MADFRNFNINGVDVSINASSVFYDDSSTNSGTDNVQSAIENTIENINNFITITSDQMAGQQYYNLQTYSIGDYMYEHIPLQSHTSIYYNYKFIAKKGSTVIIHGKGSSGRSRLYMFINMSSNTVTDIAEVSQDAMNTPLEFTFDEDTLIYGTSTSNDSYIKIYNQNPFNNPLLLRDYIVQTTGDSSTNIMSQAAITNMLSVNNEKYLTLVPNSGEITLDTNTYTMTIDASCHFFKPGFSNIVPEKITVDLTVSNFGTLYVIYNKNGTARAVPVTSLNDNISDDEGIVCSVRRATGIIKANLFNYNLNGTKINFIPLTNYVNETEYESLVSKVDEIVSGVQPKMFNPQIDLQKTELKILDIGNSYTVDCTHYLSNIIESYDIDVSDMCLYGAVRGGASYKNWYDIYHDQDTSSYYIYKIAGGLTVDTTGTAAIGNGEKFRNVLTNNKFDMIIIHQVSTYAPYYDRWEEDGSTGYLSKLIRLIRKHQPQATIGFLLVHSYWSGYSGNTEQSSLERWTLIMESAKKLKANYGIDFIIPYGTAIQNLRASSLNNEYDLTEDGTHCASGLADYTAACAYFQSIFAPRYGVSILDSSCRITVEQSGTYPTSAISVTDDNASLAHIAAYLACYNWYECQNPENFTDEF